MWLMLLSVFMFAVLVRNIKGEEVRINHAIRKPLVLSANFARSITVLPNKFMKGAFGFVNFSSEYIILIRLNTVLNNVHLVECV